MKNFIKILIFISTILLLTGCWNYRELNDLGIVSAISIKQSKENEDKIELTIQFMNIQKASGESGATINNVSMPITTTTVKGKTIHEALREATKYSPKKPYIGHMDLVVIEEETARKGIIDIIDFFLRDSESRKQFKVFISKNGDETDVLSVVSLLEGFPSKSMISTLESGASFTGHTVSVNYDELISLIFSDGIEGIAPYIFVKGDAKKGSTVDNTEETRPIANIEIEGTAIFKGNKMVGYLEEMESLGLNIIRNRLTSSTIPFICEDNKYITGEAITSKSGFDIDFSKEIPKVTLNVEMDTFLSEVNCKKNLTKTKVIKELEKNGGKEIKKIIEGTLNMVQKKYNTDVIGLGNYIKKEHYKEWKKLKDKWYDIFPNIEIEVKTKFTIVKKGETILPAEGYKLGI